MQQALLGWISESKTNPGVPSHCLTTLATSWFGEVERAEVVGNLLFKLFVPVDCFQWFGLNNHCKYTSQ
jgi:hypothetical protein